MSLVDQLIYEVRAVGTVRASEEIAQVDKSVAHSEESAKRATKAHIGLGNAFSHVKNMAVGLVSAAGIGGVAYGLSDAVKKAIAFQSTQGQLGASLRANVQHPAADATKTLTEFSDSLSMRGGFDPTTSVQGLTQLLRSTHDVTKAQQGLTLATEIARQTHKSMTASVRAVMMAEAGRTTGLTRLGIVLPKGLSSMQIMDRLQKSFAGATTAYNRSAAGAASNFRNSIDVLEQRLGSALLPMVSKVAKALTGFVRGMMTGKGAGGQFVAILKDVVRYGKEAWEWIRKNSTIIETLGGAILGIVVAYKTWMAVTKTMTAVQLALDAAMDANPVMIVVLAIAALIGALVVAYLKVKWFHDFVNTAFKAIKGFVVGAVHAIVDIFNWFKNVVTAVIDFVIRHWRLLILAFGLVGLAIDFVTAHWRTFKAVASAVINWTVGAVKWMVKAISTVASTLFQILSAPFRWTWQHVIQPVMNAIVGAFRWMVGMVEKILKPIMGPINKITSAIGSVTKAGGGVVKDVGHFLGLQHGGPVTRSGMYLVGERGPEVVALPGGSYVTPNNQLNQAQPPIILYNILDGKVLSKSVVRQGLLQQSKM